MTDSPDMDPVCPTCRSPAPHLHPAIQFEGDVHTCPDAFHLTPTPPSGRTPAMTDPAIAEALERVERHLLDLDAAASPTKSEVFTLCGWQASELAADLRILIAAARRSAPPLDREKVARIVDPDAWAYFDKDAGQHNGTDLLRFDAWKQSSLRKADLILAELDRSVLLDVVKVLEPEGEGSAGADIAASACGLTAGEDQRKSEEIATAPRDGRWIIGWRLNFRPFPTRWHPASAPGGNGPGWWGGEPTHWAPFPTEQDFEQWT